MAGRDPRYLQDAVAMAAALVVFALWVLAALAGTPERAGALDNAHCSLADCVATWLVWRAAFEPDGEPVQRQARRRFAWALTALAVAQLLFDLRGYFPWWPLFAGPDDALMFLAGPLLAAGFAGIVRRSLPRARARLVLFDVAGFCLAILTLTVALYLPHNRSGTPLQLAVFTIFPVSTLTAGALGLLMQLHLRQRWNVRWIALFSGICAFGGLQMIWYLLALDDRMQSGTPLSLALSASVLLMGWGAAGWRPQSHDSVRFDRACEDVLRQLPLALVALGSAAFGLLLLLPQRLPEPSRAALLVLALAVVLVAVLRQTQQLGERDRLLEAERMAAQSQARLQHLAHHDPLTGLPNLALLRDRVQLALARAARQGTKVAVLFVDLDQFKAVNDTFGHATGDALLRHVARLLQGMVRTSDTVSRQGGDEFTLVLTDVADLQAAVRVAKQIIEIANACVRLDGVELPLSLSVGVALYPDDAVDFAGLLQCADAAMYRAKAAGRNAFRFYDAHMNAEAARNILLRMHLARAVERGELQLHYQPLIELARGQVCGAEALLRWQSPELGSVPPASFIPVAEDFGLIVDIGGWVLLEACRAAMAWQAHTRPGFRVAVNVSVMQFRRGNIESQVAEALQASGLPPHALELEITESVLLQDPDRVIAALDRLTALGVSIALDDFGTGYSSLSYVQRMPVAKLKIDRSFVQEAPRNAGAAAIVRAVIDMARALDVVTVAEGVESEEQATFLHASRCDMAQGYRYATPRPAAAFEQFLAASAAA